MAKIRVKVKDNPPDPPNLELAAIITIVLTVVYVLLSGLPRIPGV